MNPHRFGASYLRPFFRNPLDKKIGGVGDVCSYPVSLRLSERMKVYATSCIAVIFGQGFAG